MTTPVDVSGGVFYITKGNVKVGFDMNMGGAISSILLADGAYANQNLVNNWDQGRLVQQSYYGDPDGSTWNGNAWTWNPVQGGDHTWAPGAALVNKSTVSNAFTGPGAFKCDTNPRHWATGELLMDTLMSQTISIEGNVITCEFKLKYTGTKSHTARDQELPALFFWNKLRTLVGYTGDKPWTNDPITEAMRLNPAAPTAPISPPRMIVSENWAAYVDQNNWGVGVYFPHASMLVYYVVVVPENPDESNCSYLAPVDNTIAITPGLEHKYVVYLIIDTLENIRSKVYKMKNG
jgi:hypothetical protein